MKRASVKTIVFATLGFIVFCGAFSFYLQWDTKRFIQKIGPRLTVDTSPVPVMDRQMLTAKQTATETYLPVAPIEDQPYPFETSTKVSEPPEFSELQEDLGVPEINDIDVAAEPLSDAAIDLPALVEKPIKGTEFTGSPMGNFIDVLEANSPVTSATDVVSEILRKIEGGTATSQDMLDLTQAWLSILPEDDHMNRAALMDFLKFQYELMHHTESEKTREIGVEYTFKVYPKE